MNLGDVVEVDLPRPAARPGHEQFGRRPAIIVQADEAIPNLNTVLVVPCTSKMTACRFAGAVVLQPSVGNGLTLTSVALTHQLTVVDKRRVILPRLGALSEAELAKLQTEIRIILSL